MKWLEMVVVDKHRDGKKISKKQWELVPDVIENLIGIEIGNENEEKGIQLGLPSSMSTLIDYHWNGMNKSKKIKVKEKRIEKRTGT